MSIYTGSGRKSGTRGGRAEFNWAEVKESAKKNADLRENYIGQSVKTEASWVWQGNSSAVNADKAATERELDEIRRREQMLINESLGGGGVLSSVGASRGHVSRQEMRDVLARGQLERDDKDTTAALAGIGGGKKAGQGDVLFAAAESDVMPGTMPMERPTLELPTSNVMTWGEEDEKKKKQKKKKKKKKEKKRRRRHDSPDRRSRSRSPDSSRRRRRHDSPDR